MKRATIESDDDEDVVRHNRRDNALSIKEEQAEHQEEAAKLARLTGQKGS